MMIKDELRQEILICIRANGLPVSGELWFTLVFCSESELRKIANELHIYTKEKRN